jgi:signal transduction histidine kinase
VAAASGLASLILTLLLWRLLERELEREKAREAQALLGQRLEVLGRMTGGVAHDFNNLLSPIIGGLDLLQRRLGDDPRSARLVEAALASAERARALVGQLLAFARKQALEPRDIDVAALLVGLRSLIEQSVGTSVAVDIAVPASPLHARVDPVQLELALLNLSVNARDAMPEGGRLSLSAAAAEGGPAEGLAPGPYVRVTVADTGSGMDAATLRQAIEPFFTTKPPAQGTGLGLSMVHGLAAQSGGALKLSSTPGAGATAEVWLPAAEAAQAPVPAAAE